MSVYVVAVERSVLPFLSTSCQRTLSRHIVFGRRTQTQSASIRPLLSSSTSRRSFAASSTETSKETQQGDGKVILSTPRIQTLYDEIVQLPVREVNIMGALVLQILEQKVHPGEFGHHTPLPEGMMEAAAAAAEQQEEVVEEAKTIFDVKLLGFDAKAKIKVIKEVRAITGLGLKEAKAKVESAPTVISKDVKQEQADELKEKLEAIGAEVEIV